MMHKLPSISKRLNIALGLSVIISVILYVTALFIVRSNELNNIEQFRSSAVLRILEAQQSLLSQEFINQRFYAAIERSRIVQKEISTEGISIALVGADKKVIFKSDDLKFPLEKCLSDWGPTPKICKTNGFVIAGRKFQFADETLGYALVYAEISPGNTWAFNANIISLLGIIALTFLSVTLGTRWFFRRHISQPLTSLKHAIPSMKAYMRGEIGELSDIREASTSEIQDIQDFIKGLLKNLRDEQVAREQASLELAKESAIAKTVQMLAHDVRKPFSMLTSGLNVIRHTKDPEEFQRKLKFLLSEVARARKSVDGLIADVMEVGSTSTQLLQEPVSPESLMESTLGEAFRIYQKSNVRITYDLRHRNMVNVHVTKVARLFSNIVGNALQAMKFTGHLWFTTVERDGFIQFSIGNAGSLIPSQDLAKLFDAFFTSGKKGGTGLGLAIAQKVVHAHGGKIWCESDASLTFPDGRVEFFFTLPSSVGTPCTTTSHLIEHSSEVTEALQAMMGQPSQQSGQESEAEESLEIEIDELCKKLNRRVEILIVDDESVYRNSIASFMGESTRVKNNVALAQAIGSNEALALAKGKRFDLIISDVDLGPESLDGFELTQEFRQNLGVKSLIAIHSNRICPSDHQASISSGANLFLPKPMGREQFLRLILQSVFEPKTIPLENPVGPIVIGQREAQSEANS